MPDDQNDRNYESIVINFVDKHVRHIKYISYGLGFVGLIIIGRSIHITARFRTVRDIPHHFIQRGVRVNFIPQRCDASGRLYAEHVPLLQLKRPKQADLLVIHLAGVEHTEQSVTWLQNNVIHKTIRCDMLRAREGQDLDCMVYFKMGWVRQHCLNHYLIEQGLALVGYDASMEDHWRSSSVLERLVKAEIKAEKKRRGVWQRPSLRERMKSYPEHVKKKLHLNILQRGINELKRMASNLLNKFKR